MFIFPAGSPVPFSLSLKMNLFYFSNSIFFMIYFLYYFQEIENTPNNSYKTISLPAKNHKGRSPLCSCVENTRFNKVKKVIFCFIAFSFIFSHRQQYDFLLLFFFHCFFLNIVGWLLIPPYFRSHPLRASTRKTHISHFYVLTGKHREENMCHVPNEYVWSWFFFFGQHTVRVFLIEGKEKKIKGKIFIIM